MKELRLDADGGVWRFALPLIQSATPSFFVAEISRAAAKRGSTKSCL